MTDATLTDVVNAINAQTAVLDVMAQQINRILHTKGMPEVSP